MELFLIYDILHTKAAVIHTWRYAYHVVDSAITYALLIGAILLEITTLLGTVGLWLDSIGQYNLFDFYTCDMTDLRGRIAMKVGLENWWNKLHYSSTTPQFQEISRSFCRMKYQRGD
uniref:DUF4220 domain-containing protein n=1 Tax=Oryza barthii TaxID=65489 RepID=A0A0D3FS91_9ORYZ